MEEEIVKPSTELCDDANPSDAKENHRTLWNEIVKETEDRRTEVEEYKRSKLNVLESPPHPVIDYLDENIFPTLNSALIKMLKKVKDQENQMFTEGDTYLNSLNFIAEYLWNMNPKHPERRDKWTDITGIKW